MSESKLFERIYTAMRDVINPQSHMLIDPAIKNICHEYERRIEGLERNNEILAEQIKKREGMWLAPVEPDPAMLKIAMSWFNGWAHMNNATRESNLEEAYKAMRDNWLEGQK